MRGNYATPAAYGLSSVHARNVDQPYSQSKSVEAASVVVQSGQQRVGMQRQPSQPSYEQNGQMNAVADQRQVV